MATRQFHGSTKKLFKLPDTVKKGQKFKAYSTSTCNSVGIEGYEGKIQTIKQKDIKKDFIPCRPVTKHGGKAWVQLLT